MEASAGRKGQIIMPQAFAIDLHRWNSMWINGQRVFNKEGHTPETVDQACQEMNQVLGVRPSIMAAHLLNQAGITKAYVHFAQEKIQEGPLYLNQSDKNQLVIDIEEEKVILKIKCVFAIRPLPGKEPKNFLRYLGMEAKYHIAREELEELGALSINDLKEKKIEEVVPSAEAT